MHADMARFLDQNDDAAATLTPELIADLEPYASHHAGGLYVCIASLGGTRYVKMHDDWGRALVRWSPQCRPVGSVVVHEYDADDETAPESVNAYETGADAARAFLARVAWAHDRTTRTFVVVVRVDDDDVTVSRSETAAAIAARLTSIYLPDGREVTTHADVFTRA